MNPLLLEIPEEIETARLLLRAPRADDAQSLNQAINASFDDLNPWMAWAKNRHSLEESQASARRFVADWIVREHLDYRLWLKENGELVGCCGLHTFQWDVPKGEIGYWLRSGYGGRGLMNEAVAALRDLGLQQLNLRRLEIRCDSRNQNSAKVAVRAGFAQVARLENNWRGRDGLLRHSLIFAITQNDDQFDDEFSRHAPEAMI